MAVALRRSESGQATLEYLVVVTAMLIAIAVLGFVMQPHLGHGVGGAIFAALGTMLEEMTFLINLPF